MIKRNGDNVFAIASGNSQCARSAAPVCQPQPPAGTRIPQPRTRMPPPAADTPPQTKEANIALGTYVEKWKNKYEEAERRHKSALLRNEKARREQNDLERRFKIQTEELGHSQAELRERERELDKLRAASERLFHDYRRLRHQQETDSGLMNKVMQQAGEWYKQNKQLKRRSTALLQALPTKPVELDLTDSIDNVSESSSNEEVEFLKQTVSELGRRVAALQTELETLQLQEFEAQQQIITLSQEIEEKDELLSAQSSELSELRSRASTHGKLASLLVEEVAQLKLAADEDRQLAQTYKSEARQAKKRVTVLQHGSALLLGELEPGDRLLGILAEVDSLKEALERQALAHQEEMDQLQLQLAEKNEETDVLLWEEKIKLAEEDAKKMLERAERAERRLAEMDRNPRGGQKRGNLMSRISYFENAGDKKERDVVEEKRVENAEEKKEREVVEEKRVEDPHILVVEEEMVEVVEELSASPQCPPRPPPPPECHVASPPRPPPPPPPPPVFAGAGGEGLAHMLSGRQGSLKRTQQNGGGAIDAIVDQIKGGKFQLKSTNENFLERKPKQEQPEVVKEMLNILGTLRKRRSNSRPSFVSTNSVEGAS